MKWRNYVRGLFHEGPLLDYYRFTSPFPKTKLRLYTELDFDSCCELYKLNETGRFPPGYDKVFENYLKSQTNLILVIEEKGRVIGTGGICLCRCNDEINIASIAYGLIHPDYQRKGFGTLLFCTRLCYLSAWRNWLVTMSSAGNGTEEYYKKLGFAFRLRSQCEFGAMLEHYHVIVLGKDIAKMHELVLQSGSVDELDFKATPPEKDLPKDSGEACEPDPQLGAM